MTGILITFDIASLVLLIWVFIQGFYAGETVAMRSHITTALMATALNVFAHCMTMMYVVATGRMIRQVVEKGALNQEYVSETKIYRKRVFKSAVLAMTIVMLQTILGGGVHTKVLGVWFHLFLGVLMLIVCGYAVLTEIRYLISNHMLGHRVAREFEALNKENVNVR